MSAEHIQDQRSTVDDLDLGLLAVASESPGRERRLQVALLRRRQFVVEDNDTGVPFLDQFLQLVQLALADVGGREPVGPLVYGSHHFGASRLGEVPQLAQRVIQRPQLVAALQLDRNQYGALLLRRYVNQPRSRPVPAGRRCQPVGTLLDLAMVLTSLRGGE